MWCVVFPVYKKKHELEISDFLIELNIQVEIT